MEDMWYLYEHGSEIRIGACGIYEHGSRIKSVVQGFCGEIYMADHQCSLRLGFDGWNLFNAAPTIPTIILLCLATNT
jgi:hypothetical protein